MSSIRFGELGILIVDEEAPVYQSMVGWAWDRGAENWDAWERGYLMGAFDAGNGDSALCVRCGGGRVGEVERAVLAEREACAKLCEELREASHLRLALAAAIRARGGT